MKLSHGRLGINTEAIGPPSRVNMYTVSLRMYAIRTGEQILSRELNDVYQLLR